MKVSVIAALLCLFSATVLAASPPPPPPGKICRTLFREPGRNFVVESVSGRCKTLPTAAHPFRLEIIEPPVGHIAAFYVPQCQGPKLFDRQTPVQLGGPTNIVSFITTC